MSGTARKLGVALVACLLLLTGVGAAAQTHDVLKKGEATPQAFLDALTPATPAASDASQPAERRTRSFKVMKSGAVPEGGGMSVKPASVSTKPASASVMITFETESSRLTADSKRILGNLAVALNSDQLARFRFNIEGHADARGTSERNLKLSQERAEAVREHLVSKLQIDPARLIALGKGDTEQLNKENPAAAENRRVRIVTLTD
jgi:outer membrane protein OmpA-like peptidoglycan-associated protein